MEWMWNALWARIGWAVGELALLVGVVALFVVGALLWQMRVSIKQRRCAHVNMRQMPSSPLFRCATCGLLKYPTNTEGKE